MKSVKSFNLFLIFVFTSLISLTGPSFSQEETMEQQKQQMQQQVEQQKEQMMQQGEQQKEQMMQNKGAVEKMVGKKQTVEGNVICVQVDEKGNVNAMEQYTECKGVFVVVGKDGKIYTLSGTEEQMKMMAKSPHKMASGQVGGHQRAWIIYGTGAPLDIQKGTQQTVTGTIVCLLPNYAKGTVTPVVGTGPCNEAMPHAHVIYTKDGQVYALSGSEAAIGALEKSPQRTNVPVTGKVLGNQGAWVLYVE
ncbi:MAG TPA: hypothetical protein VH878_09750 [Thermodesulfobacteriota bacterium]